MILIMSQQRAVVAIIDDNSYVRNALENLLSAYGYATELYASAKEFLEAATQSKALCLIVDVQLGNSCGIALVRQLGQLGVVLPTIFVTASDSTEMERRARETGCIAFLRKPVDVESLMEKLSALKI
jgi:FixJ family two-component response regulator